MSLDLFSAVGFNSYFFFFPFVFFFYYSWVNLLMMKKKVNWSLKMNQMTLKIFSSKVQSSTSNRIYFSSFLISKVFLFLVYSKLWNLIPLTVSVSSKLMFTLSLAVLCWFTIKISSLLKNFMVFFSHYTTLGSPMILIPFMKVIEVVSKIMRPMTLGVRLAVNLLTGHLLLSMFSSFHNSLLLYSKCMVYLLMVTLGLGLFFYEFCVCLIQALVYALMISQYFDEHS